MMTGAAHAAADAKRPWLDAAQSPDARAEQLVKAMTLDEKIQTVFGYFSTDFESKQYTAPKDGRKDSAGFVPGIERLGLPSQWQTDAGMGVATQAASKSPLERTSLPSGLSTAATWDRKLAYAGGHMIGSEARQSGFNIMLAGSVNLMREPRNGRNFEYGGEDPLLAGVMVGEQIRGIQANNVVSTLKHFAFNDQETNRFHINVKIDDAAGRMSDLLALQLAMEVGDPGSVMCAYNRVNGPYACESDYLLNEVLKKDWGFKGYVMSDWGATHSTIPAAIAGLDQQSGHPFDKSAYFNDALKEAVVNGHVPQSRLDDMVKRITRTMFAHGLAEHPVKAATTKDAGIDYATNGKISQAGAEDGIVLLKNSHDILPLAATVRTIAIIGGHSDVGVMSGGGSAQVYPVGLSPVPNEGPQFFPGPMVYHRSSPMQELASRTKAKLSYADGKDVKAAAKLAAASDLVIVFGNQWTAESIDAPDLNLPNKQDDLIAAVAKANGKTVVVLQTGGPVVMPWLNNVAAVLEAWYPGSNGGAAIARVLTGEVNPSGRLPATFPASVSQLPRPKLDGDAVTKDENILNSLTTNYNIEGAAVGYKWFDLKGHKPLFPFGYGLSYTTFAMSDLAAAKRDKGIEVTFNVTNTGKRDGKAVGQVYIAPAKGGWEAPKRLGGWDKLAVKAGETGKATVKVDPRLLAMYDSASKTWKIAPGEYVVTLAESAGAKPAATVKVSLDAQTVDIHGK
ncbi:beta-glucosidase [Duganella sp. Leaf126]|uniref:glycoside hydrolase family 3 C-terminal domain-containing protein n=1 Tax=Duganella sp. Leaf126 TaxID=1736266 RepID=UPI00070199F7|nr:glycoside hydrolase family 3 C-terminal domain-containing protein [Duganella sp. Leaf126]KQQ36312.1 beta-glucosidase [Duganella sp. Leaf126]